MATDTEKLPYSPHGCNLSKRGQEIFEKLCLWTKDNGGYLSATTEEIAAHCGVSRRSIYTYLRQLKKGGLISELEAVSGNREGEWRRIRRINPQYLAQGSFPNPFPNPFPNLFPNPLITNDVSAKPPNPTGSDGFALRCAERGNSKEAILEDTILTDLFDYSHARRPFDKSLLPAYPDSKKCEPVVVPRMPSLRGSKAYDANLLIKAFKAACHKWYGVKPQVKKPDRYRMGAAGQAFFNTGVLSPFAWASYRLVSHQLTDRKDAPPVVNYVFSRKVLEKHHQHFKQVVSSHEILDKRVLTPSHQKLILLWEKTISLVGCPKSGPAGEETTKAIIHSVLPPSTYQRLLVDSRDEHRAMTADFYRRYNAGEWIW